MQDRNNPATDLPFLQECLTSRYTPSDALLPSMLNWAKRRQTHRLDVGPMHICYSTWVVRGRLDRSVMPERVQDRRHSLTSRQLSTRLI